MPLRKSLFQIKYDNLQRLVDVDDSAGRSVPINMNFTEEGYLTKDKGFEFMGAEDDKLRHSLYKYKKSNGKTYILSAKGTKLQSWAHSYIFTAATSGVITAVGHGYANDDKVTVTSEGTMPAGLVEGAEYFVVNVSGNTFKLSNTLGGTAINITTTGTGSHFVKRTTDQWEDLEHTWTEGEKFGFTDYDDVLYGGNGVDDFLAFDGETIVKDGAVPKGNVYEVFEDRLFITGNKENPLSYYYSDVASPLTFQASSVLKPLGTDVAITMKNYYGSLLLFKERSIWKMTFEYNQVAALFLPKLVNQSRNYGACSSKAVVWVENDIWFFTGRELRSIGFQDNQAGVFGINESVISEQIKQTLNTKIKVSNYRKISCYYKDRRFYLCVPLNSDELNVTFVNHLLYGRVWTKYVNREKAHIEGLIDVDEEVYTLTSKAPYRYIKWTDSLNDGDAAISSEVFFKRIEAEIFNQFRIMRYVDTKFKDLLATVNLVIKSEASDVTRVSEKNFYIGNQKEDMEGALGETPVGEVLVSDSFGENVGVSPFVKKRTSILLKAQAMIIGIRHARKDETFTFTEFILLGTEEPRKQISGRKIISIR